MCRRSGAAQRGGWGGGEGEVLAAGRKALARREEREKGHAMDRRFTGEINNTTIQLKMTTRPNLQRVVCAYRTGSIII